MRTTLYFISILFIFCFLTAYSWAATNYSYPAISGSIRYKVRAKSKDQKETTVLSQWLSQHDFDVAGTNWRDGEVEVVTNQQGIDFLSRFGLRGKMFSSEFNVSVDSKYLNPQTLNQKIYDLARKYPTLTIVENIGTTLQGKPILALLLSDTPAANDLRALDKPSILFDGEHHAREVMTPEIVLDVATTMLEGFNKDQNLTQLLSKWNIWLVPMVNPDGSNLVFSGKSMWRKNAHAKNGNTYGVDINRNYDYKWNACSGSSSYNWAQDYRGDFAASEPETRALMNLAQKIKPAAYLSYHSYSELVLYPYGCRNSLTPEHSMVEKIAHELAEKLPSDSGSGNYTAGSAWEILYDVDGDSMGYMYGAFGALSYTFEVNRDFQPNYALREPTVAKHRVAWKYFLNRIDANLLKIIVVDGQTDKGIPATVDINTIAHLQAELPFQTNESGRFFKVLENGRHVITAKLADGRSGQAIVDMNGKSQETKIAVF